MGIALALVCEGCRCHMTALDKKRSVLLHFRTSYFTQVSVRSHEDDDDDA